MGNMVEQMFFSRMLGGGRVWLEVAFLACMFGALLFRTEKIKSFPLFKAAYCFFALSIMVPGLATFAFSLLSGGNMGRGALDGWFAQFLSASGPMLFGVSIICAFGSLLPGFIPPPTSRPSERDDGAPPLS